ncbi:MAG: hypothetical protein R2863_11305 [Candidatus Kapaibacterium sp.]|nr:hypothetical protein [Ignavibacteria bacterium]
MKISEIINNKAYLLKETILRLGFTLVEVSKSVYPHNHINYLSGKFSEQRIKPKDTVKIIEYLSRQVGKPVVEMEYQKLLDRYNKIHSSKKF